jgi:hypothetical protein
MSSDSAIDWYSRFMDRVHRSSHCLALLEKVVSEPAGTVANIEEIVAMGPELKETYGKKP